jgi:hypothetical protein
MWGNRRAEMDLAVARIELEKERSSAKFWRECYESVNRLNQTLLAPPKPNPDAWRTVVLDEDVAKYFTPKHPGKGIVRPEDWLAQEVDTVLRAERYRRERDSFDAKVAESIERLAEKPAPPKYPETIYGPKAKAPVRGKGRA